MKKGCIFLVVLLSGKIFCTAQYVKEVYNAKKIAWLGVDFTKSKMIGDFEQDGNEKNLRDNFFIACNDVIINEKLKYNLGEILNKETIIYSVEKVSNFNSQINPDSIKLNSAGQLPLFSLKTLNDITQKYAEQDKDGFGVLVVVEKFDKSHVVAIVDLVFIERNTGKLLFAKRFTRKPKGIGLRNFWARSFYEMFTETRKSWKSWMNEDERTVRKNRKNELKQ